MKTYGLRDRAFVMARIDAEVRGAAATAANFEITRDAFLALAGRAYDQVSDLFEEAAEIDQQREEEAVEVFFAERAQEGDDDDDGAEQVERRADPIRNELWASGGDMFVIDSFAMGNMVGTGRVTFHWISGPDLAGLEGEVDIDDLFFQMSERLGDSLAEYQLRTRPSVVVGQVWDIFYNEEKENAGRPRGQVVVTGVDKGVGTASFRWISGLFSGDVETRDDHANVDFLYAHGLKVADRPVADSGQVWKSGGDDAYRVYQLTDRYIYLPETGDAGAGWRFLDPRKGQQNTNDQWLRDCYFTGDFERDKAVAHLKAWGKPAEFLGYRDDVSFRIPE